MSARSSSEQKTPEFKKSLQRWGTEEGIIDVADDKTRQGNTSEQKTLTYKKLLHRWRTELGIIDVADHEKKHKNSSEQKTPTYKNPFYVGEQNKVL